MDKQEMMKNKILVASNDLLMSVGEEKFTVADICKRCKISKNTLYKYFSSKEELISCLNKDLDARPKNPENMMDLIISNAKDLIFQKGFYNLDMNELSNMTGIARTTLYSYFKNSTEILQHILMNELKNRELKEKYEQVQNKTSVERLNWYVDYHLSLVQDKNILRLIIEMISNAALNDKIKQGLLNIEEHSINNLIDAIELGKKEYNVSFDIDSKMYSKLTYMLSYGVFVYTFLHPDDDTYNELKSYLAKYVIDPLFDNKSI